MPVVYDGVAGNPHGDLFQDLKIWISHRVPLRSRWVDLVEGNGGKVVKLETKADMKMADNVKRGGVVPPPGSYSYQWIEFSVKNGQLENKDDYEIGPPQGISRQTGSAQQTKTTRTTFTKMDDLILTKWVLCREWKGQAASGNEMYKELERQHPRHTWQSWRDRWVKKLKDQPRPSISPESLELEQDQDASDARTPAEAAATSTTPAKPTHERQTSQVKPLNPGPSSSERRDAQRSISTDNRPSPKRRRFFTEEEDQMLIAFVQEARDRGGSINGNLIYQQFAEEHPSRTWQSWRDRWVRHLSLRDASLNNISQRTTAAENVAPAKREDIKRQSITTERTSEPSKPDVRNGGPSKMVSIGTTGAGPEHLSPEQKPNAKSDDERLRRQEETKRRLRAAKTLQRRWRGYSVRRDQATLEAAVVPLQSMIRGYLARQNAVIRRAESYHADQQTAETDLVAYSQQHEDHFDGSQYEAISPTEAMPQRDRDPMDQFYRDLETYIEGSGADIDNKPSIRGSRIDLWDLYRIATKQDCQPEQRNMRIVADELGLEWRKSPDILDELRQVYQKNLADFEDAINSFDNERLKDDVLSEDAEQIDDTEKEGLPETTDAVTGLKRPLIGHSSPGYRSSPPVAGSKRSRRYGDLLTSDPGYPSDGSRKRRRLDKSSVIPPTPEGKLVYSTERSQHLSAQNYTSPLKPRGDNSELPIDVSSDEESRMLIDEDWDQDQDQDDGQNELPSHNKGTKQKGLEPETQDWGFAPAPQRSELHDSIEADDVSPSEQLQLEFKKHNSPGQHPPSKTTIGTRAKALPTSAPTSGKAAERHLTGGLRRSTRQQTAAQQSSTTASRSVVETKAKKRALPAECRQKAPTNGMREAAPLLDSSPSLQKRPQPQVPTSSKAPAAAPVRTPKVTHRSYSTAYTPSPATPAVNRPVSALATRVAPSIQSSSRFSPEVYDDAYVQAQIDHFEALGYNGLHVGEAMLAAAFQRGPQNVALESLHKGLGIPQNEQGVWTKKDDSDLRMIRQYEQGALDGRDSDKMKVEVWSLRNRLTSKHGEKGVKLRQQFQAEMLDREQDRKGKARAE